MSIRPSFAQGYASSRYESIAPSQWEGLIQAGAPVLGMQSNIVYDLSGNQRHAVGSGLTLPDDWVVGQGGLAVRGDGSNNYLDVGTLPSISAFTFMCTAQRENIASGYRVIAGFVASYYGLVVYDDGVVRLLSTGGSILLTWTGVWTDEAFPHHIAIVQEATGASSGVSLYFDGILISRQTTTTTALNGLRIMEQRTAFGQPFIGPMHEWRLYDRALPGSMVAEIARDSLTMYRLRPRVWVIGGGGAALIKVVADDLDLEDSISRNLTISRFSTDDLEFDDQIGRNLTLLRFTVDDLELTDPINRNLTLTRLFTEDLELTDSNPHLKVMPRSVVDDLELTDTDLKTLGFTRSATDDLDLTDSNANFLGKTRFTTDDLSLVDSPSRLMEMRRSAIDVLNLISISQRGRGLVRSVVDLLSLLDSIPRFGSKMRAVVDDLELTDSTHKAAEFIKSVVDDLNLTDSVQKVLGFVRSVVDEIEFVDTVQKVVNAVGEGAARIIQRGIKWFRHGGTS